VDQDQAPECHPDDRADEKNPAAGENHLSEGEAAMKWLSGLFRRNKTMAALTAGSKAPQFELSALEGPKFSLRETLSRGPVLAIFFKISCPVCQYGLPFFERIHRAYGGQRLAVVGISQNEKQDTEEFTRKFGITFPVLLDDTTTFPVSNAYGLETVPTAFWISEDGEIEISSVSWSRQDFEQIAAKAAETSGSSPVAMFQPSEKVADFRAG
jgi:peroxiredoxin